MREVSKIVRDANGEAVRTEKRQVQETISINVGDLHDLELRDGTYLFAFVQTVTVRDGLVDFRPVAGMPVDAVEELGARVIDHGSLKAHIARSGLAFSVTQLCIADAPAPVSEKKRRVGFIQ